MSKTDLSDGFYQVHLTPSGVLKLAVLFTAKHQEPMVGIPTRLPMGWTKSPPAFSAVTEMIADLVNSALECSDHIPPLHPLEVTASKPVSVRAPLAKDSFPIQDPGPLQPPLAYVDVYVDNFIKLAQGWSNALKVHCHTYHHINSVFCPNDRDDVNSTARLLSQSKSWRKEMAVGPQRRSSWGGYSTP